jgi:hypothetical protein
MSSRVRTCASFLFAIGIMGASARAQDQQPKQMPMSTPAKGGWMFMYDGILFAMFIHQGGPRGGNQFVAPNWWMGMASRETSHGRLTFNGMLSLDPATVGEKGYRQIFQVGEAYNGQPLIDYQHPHDLFMQLAAIWRIPVAHSMGFTLAGGPVGEPALGPVAFMHRASAADNPTAPLSHHTFDSTHIAFGVVTAAVDHGSWVIEGSIFNGREPDQNRWDFDFGRLDSVSGRIWYRPNDEWEFQVSSGRLVSPEELEPGHNIIRSTASGSWTRKNGPSIASVTVGIGVNDTDHGTRGAMFAEGARHTSTTTIYGRFEALQTETALLLMDVVPDDSAADAKDTLAALTAGVVRDVWSWRGLEGGVGADVTFYGVPSVLKLAYGSHPVSFHVFFRLRPPPGPMGRMWNMRMSQPMAAHPMNK